MLVHNFLEPSAKTFRGPSAEPSAQTFRGTFRKKPVRMGKGRPAGPKPSGILPESFRKPSAEKSLTKTFRENLPRNLPQGPSAKPSAKTKVPKSSEAFRGTFRENLPGTFRENLPQKLSTFGDYLPRKPFTKTFHGTFRVTFTISGVVNEHKYCT